jgi:hypothetical protein
MTYGQIETQGAPMIRYMSLFAVMALAQPAVAGELTQDQYTFCDAMARLEENIVRSYQKGLSLSEALQVLDRQQSSQLFSALAKSMIIEVYGRPRYDTKEVQEREVAEMRDKIHVQCLNSYLNGRK